MDDQPTQPIVSQAPQPTSQQLPTKSKSSFTIFFVAVLFIILIAAVAYGLYSWQHNKVTQANSKLSSLQSQLNKANLNTNESGSSNTVASGKYLEIPQYNIKFRLSSAISDAYYAYNADGYIYLSVHKFDNDGGLSGCSASTSAKGNLGVVALIVAVPGQLNGDFAGDSWTLASIKQAGLTKVGDAYYGFQHGNGACYNPNDTDASSEAAQYNTVEQAFMAAEPTITSAL